MNELADLEGNEQTEEQQVYDQADPEELADQVNELEMFETNNSQPHQQMSDSLIVADDHRRKSQMVDYSSLLKLQDKGFNQELTQQYIRPETSEVETQTDQALLVSSKC
jgi:hypothetical protein